MDIQLKKEKNTAGAEKIKAPVHQRKGKAKKQATGEKSREKLQRIQDEAMTSLEKATKKKPEKGPKRCGSS